MLQHITVHDVVRHWDGLREVLAPAIATDERTAEQVKTALLTQDMTAWAIPGGVLVTATGTSKRDGLQLLWVLYVAGKATGRGEYQDLSRALDDLAMRSGCLGLELEGKRSAKWARVLGGFVKLGPEMYRRML